MTQRGSGRHFGTAQPTSRLRRDQVLLLYRRILKAAAQFPSIKRASIIEDIKIEFRENAGETNTQKIELHHATAQRSYTQLLTYCGFDPDDPDWEMDTSPTHPLRREGHPSTKVEPVRIAPPVADASPAAPSTTGSARPSEPNTQIVRQRRRR